MNGKRQKSGRWVRLSVLAVLLGGWAVTAPGCIYERGGPGYWHHHHGW